MQELYRVISRDYKSSYDYWTTRKEIFDLFANSDGYNSPEVPEELAEKYGHDDPWEMLDDVEFKGFPCIILDETEQYMN